MVPRPIARLGRSGSTPLRLRRRKEHVAGTTPTDPARTAAAAVRSSAPPIFVIGSPRSGTTLLRLMLDSHPRISCGEETHFLRDLEAIVGRDWQLVRTYGLDREWWLDRIRALYEDFQTAVLSRSGKARWAEKDPTYTLHLPFIEELFPDALYVHLLRDGHDVVASFRDRWGYRSAARAARTEWARYVSAAQALGARLPHERFLEDLLTAVRGDRRGRRAVCDHAGSMTAVDRPRRRREQETVAQIRRGLGP